MTNAELKKKLTEAEAKAAELFASLEAMKAEKDADALRISKLEADFEEAVLVLEKYRDIREQGVKPSFGSVLADASTFGLGAAAGVYGVSMAPIVGIIGAGFLGGCLLIVGREKTIQGVRAVAGAYKEHQAAKTAEEEVPEMEPTPA